MTSTSMTPDPSIQATTPSTDSSTQATFDFSTQVTANTETWSLKWLFDYFNANNTVQIDAQTQPKVSTKSNNDMTSTSMTPDPSIQATTPSTDSSTQTTFDFSIQVTASTGTLDSSTQVAPTPMTLYSSTSNIYISQYIVASIFGILVTLLMWNFLRKTKPTLYRLWMIFFNQNHNRIRRLEEIFRQKDDKILEIKEKLPVINKNIRMNDLVNNNSFLSFH
ncbi:hypothetical protein C1645_317190 [Glomus cerebriforme]|uniref:Uncharacterized protein n=1 Tax=Glomus cerebriforme TaxID=658196 RepID=A0A397SPF7_9GLOM|nr:hypothetical protein C1645_317190 [Glomus cerebriforme]